MNCSCVAIENDGSSEVLSKKNRIARKRHKCYECGVAINIGDVYENFVGISEGDFFQSKTCLDCLSIRDEFFCGSWSFGMILSDLRDHIDEMDGEISSSCIIELTKTAKDRVCDLIEDYWSQWEDDDEQCEM